MWIEDWVSLARCRAVVPDDLYVAASAQHQAKEVCGACPVRTECLAEALDHQIEWGVWGGTTERERRLILKRTARDSWRSVLETARDRYETVPARR
jgi:WhiB family redox-sensing transcriptional regulator